MPSNLRLHDKNKVTVAMISEVSIICLAHSINYLIFARHMYYFPLFTVSRLRTRQMRLPVPGAQLVSGRAGI